LYSCARPAAPTGGPSDKIAPTIDTEKSSSNYQTQFSNKELVFEFDEYIVIKNATDQVIISPPTTNYLDYKVRGKKLTVTFPEGEALKENTTYQINFGNAIQDFTEGNPVEDFIYVFSTGNKIDSLEISGKVNTLDTQEEISDVLVLLYKNLADSILYLEKPFYYSRTKEDGSFIIKNIKEGTYQLFALKDNNLSLTYDDPTELTGFIDSLIVLTDSTQLSLEIEIFDEREIPKIQKVNQSFNNIIKVTFTEKPRNLSFSLSDSIKYFQQYDEDTLNVYYQTELDSFDIYFDWEETKDTTNIKTGGRKKSNNKLRCQSCSNQKKFTTDDTLELVFNYPISAINLDSIHQVDTMDQFQISDYNMDHNTLLLIGQFKDTGSYDMKLLPGFVTDFLDRTHDTINYKFNSTNEIDKGNIILTIQNINEESDYIYKLLDKNKKIIKTIIHPSDSLLYFNRLAAGNYSLEVIEDLNLNRYWDSGNFGERKRAEPTNNYPLEELRPGWDLETSLTLKSDIE